MAPDRPAALVTGSASGIGGYQLTPAGPMSPVR